MMEVFGAKNVCGLNDVRHKNVQDDKIFVTKMCFLFV